MIDYNELIAEKIANAINLDKNEINCNLRRRSSRDGGLARPLKYVAEKLGYFVRRHVSTPLIDVTVSWTLNHYL